VSDDDVVSVLLVLAPLLEQAERARRARVEIGKRRRMDSFQVREFVARIALCRISARRSAKRSRRRRKKICAPHAARTVRDLGSSDEVDGSSEARDRLDSTIAL
jgi:hypothetical protein